jgi:hypothetical protein
MGIPLVFKEPTAEVFAMLSCSEQVSGLIQDCFSISCKTQKALLETLK